MTAALLAAPALTVGDRCEVTPEARRIIRPKARTTGRIAEDLGDCWRVHFDGAATNPRVVLKAFIQEERR